ncbi:NAD-dependent epimerase/dehydratase family protein [Robbsia sp. KACC 23696]|uniref:NAD-dependent epimerase/dehydratase family protein n=1 Tax=Robbsia sp. KACC 23696 TaxID=3149231 RepID=UPI00325B051F
MRILITGASGFVGRALSRALLQSGATVYALSGQSQGCASGVTVWRTLAPDFVDAASAWPANTHIDCVVHLAARVHQRDEGGQPLETLLTAYRETNVTGTLRVAKAAVAAGATRFVFISSIKAMGEAEPGTPPHPWSESDTPAPVDAYGISKWEAEQALHAYGAETGLEIVVIRPPLVYGPGVKANFRQLIRLAALGWPLPLGAIDAPRSMVFVGNLVDAIQLCSTHPAAVGQTFNVADGEDLTVPGLIQRIAENVHVRSRLLPVPVLLLRILGKLSGRGDQIQRLVTPLRLDIRHIRRTLHWSPPFSVSRGLMDTVADYQLQRETGR